MMNLIVNGQEHYIADNAPDIPLYWYLHEELGLLGTKYNCGIGECGRCTVQVEGQPTRACITPLSAVYGKEVRTIEGMKTMNDEGAQIMRSLKQAFNDQQLGSCNWCINGQIMTAAALLQENPLPDSQEICEQMANNFCICSRYVQIFNAVDQVIEERASL